MHAHVHAHVHVRHVSTISQVIPGLEPKDEDLLFNPAATGQPAVAAAVTREAEEATVVAAAAGGAGVPGVHHSRLGLAHDRMHGGVKGGRKSKKDKLREQAMAQAAAARRAS